MIQDIMRLKEILDANMAEVHSLRLKLSYKEKQLDKLLYHAKGLLQVIDTNTIRASARMTGDPVDYGELNTWQFIQGMMDYKAIKKIVTDGEGK